MVPSSVIGPGLGATMRTISGCPRRPPIRQPQVDRAASAAGDLFGDRLAGVLGLEHDQVAGAAQDLAHQPGRAGVGSSTTTAPSASSSTTVRSSRSQRARSGETQTRATLGGRHLAVGHPALDPGQLLDLGPRLEALLGERRLLDPVELEVADALSGQVVALDVPALAPVLEPVGLDLARSVNWSSFSL